MVRRRWVWLKSRVQLHYRMQANERDGASIVKAKGNPGKVVKAYPCMRGVAGHHTPNPTSRDED